MHQRRQLTDQVAGPIPFRPAAAPVDTYAGSSAGSKLGQIAESLSALSPALARFSDTQFKRQTATDEIAAEKFARETDAKMKASAQTYADAIKAGDIEPNQSPWFRHFAKQQFGRLAAARFGGDFTAAVANELSPDASLQDFDKFTAAYQKDWMAKNVSNGGDLSFEQGFGAQSTQDIGQLRSAWAIHADKQAEENQRQAHAQELTTILRESAKANLMVGLSGMPISPDDTKALAARIDALNNAAITANPRIKTELNQMTAQAIMLAAVNEKDESLLKVADLVRAGTGKLANTGIWQEMMNKNKPEFTIAQARNDEARQRLEGRKLENEVQTTAAYKDVFDVLEKAGQKAYTVDLSPQIAALAKFDPEAALKINTIKEAFLAGEYATTRSVTMPHLLSAIYSERITTVDPIVAALKARTVTWQDAQNLRSELAATQSAMRSGKVASVMRDPVFATYANALRSSFMKIGGMDAEAVVAATAAQGSLTLTYIKWLADHPKATDEEKTLFLSPAYQATVKKHGGSEMQNVDLGRDKAASALPSWSMSPVMSAEDLQQLDRDIATSNTFSLASRRLLKDKYRISEIDWQRFYRAQAGLLSAKPSSP